MTYINEPAVTYADSPNLDSFGRLRVSNPVAEFASFNEYRINPFDWVTYTTPATAASVSHSTTTKMVTLSTGGTASGTRAVLQTRSYMRYNPGKSLYTAQTFVMGSAPPANCEKRAGYYDDSNGFFLSYSSTGISLVRRSNVSGSVVDTPVSQSNWNIDKMNGTGPSRQTLNLAYGQIFAIDFQFLGMGRVRLGFDIDGVLYYVHEFIHANRNETQPYIATANLPLRFEIINTGTAGSSASMQALCGKVDSEGGTEDRGIQYSVANVATPIATTTNLKPIISIRPGPTFNGITNRGWILPQQIEMFVTGNVDHYYEIIWNATLTGASWTVVNAQAMGEYDVSATAVSLGSGVVLDRGYLSAAGGSNRAIGQNGVFSERPLVNSFDGTTPDTITLCMRTLSGSGNGYGAITWFGLW